MEGREKWREVREKRKENRRCEGGGERREDKREKGRGAVVKIGWLKRGIQRSNRLGFQYHISP